MSGELAAPPRPLPSAEAGMTPEYRKHLNSRVSKAVMQFEAALRLDMETSTDLMWLGRYQQDMPAVLTVYDALRTERDALAARVTALEGAVTGISEGDVIAVGEPGCYVVAGHIGIAGIPQMLRVLFDLWEEDWDHLGEPYHGWMMVSGPDVDGFQQFREVACPGEGVLPYTIVPVQGYWTRPAIEGATDDHAEPSHAGGAAPVGGGITAVSACGA